jgi:hypothetical protein
MRAPVRHKWEEIFGRVPWRLAPTRFGYCSNCGCERTIERSPRRIRYRVEGSSVWLTKAPSCPGITAT